MGMQQGQASTLAPHVWGHSWLPNQEMSCDSNPEVNVSQGTWAVVGVSVVCPVVPPSFPRGRVSGTLNSCIPGWVLGSHSETLVLGCIVAQLLSIQILWTCASTLVCSRWLSYTSTCRPVVRTLLSDVTMATSLPYLFLATLAVKGSSFYPAFILWGCLYPDLSLSHWVWKSGILCFRKKGFLSH